MSEFLDAAQASPYRAPVATPPGDLYFTFSKPDGDTFLAAAAQAEGYLRLGYTVTGEQTLSDSDAFRDAVSPGSLLPPASGVEGTEATATPGAMPQGAPKA
jgi:hypothetical protein